MNFINCLNGNNIERGDGTMQLNNVEILYTKVQRVYVKPQQKEERQRELRVNVEIHSGISPVCRKSLCVLLADDDDPCFLYSLLINDDDFKILKAQQGLLVDFDNFATQLICLLEQCNLSISGLSKNPPKFLLILAEETGEWIFKLVETNNFKHLCHLSLSISVASDSDIKTHMAMKIKKLKEDYGNKCRDAMTIETRLNSLSDDYENKIREFEHLQQEYLSEKSQLQMTLTHQLSIEKDRLMQAKLELQRTSELEKIDAERHHSETLKQLHTELAELRAQNITYKDKQSYLEATNKEQSRQLQNIEKELNLAQRDLSQMRKQNSKLDIDYHDKDKTVNDLRMRVAVLEQELKDKIILINKNTEMLKIAKEQKQQLDELLTEKENQLQRKLNALKSVGEEVIKANEIIKKLQNELSTAKSKLKLRTSICLEQEKLLDTKQKEIGQLETKSDDNGKEIKELKLEINGLKEQIKLLQSQIDDKDKTIKNNDNVISWLNRRLADYQPASVQNLNPTIGPINVPSTFQLTLPRTNKFLTSKYETKTPLTSSTQQQQQQNGPTGSFNFRNSTMGNMNNHQTAKLSSVRSNGVGIVTDSIVGSAAFNRPGQISSTSTPMDRMNIYQKLPNSGNNDGNGINENNNILASNSGKTKGHNGASQGSLRRTVLDKPLLPSTYFPKSLH